MKTEEMFISHLNEITKCEIDKGMSNFDGEIDAGMGDKLKENPCVNFGIHSGWNFNGQVYFKDGKFYEDVHRYHTLREVISADTLKELMDSVNSKYGYE